MTLAEQIQFRDCPWCGLRDAHHHVLLDVTPADRAGDRTREHRRHWALVVCPRCAGAIVLEIDDQVSRVIGQHPPGGGEHLDILHLPDPVARHYRDARVAYDCGLPDLAAVALRRCLEAASAHHGHGQGPLFTRIAALADAGLITRPFVEVLHHVRQLGNAGAHDQPPVPDQAVHRALAFTTQVLRNLFEIPAQLADLVGDPDPPA